MSLIEREKLREMLVREQGKYIMSDHMQNKHISAGFLLAIAELDSLPDVDAISVEWIEKYLADIFCNASPDSDEFQRACGIGCMLEEWKKRR